MVLRLGALRKKHLISKVRKRKMVGRCDHCKDPIYGFQKKVEMHEGCVELESLDREQSMEENQDEDHKR